MPTLIFVPQLLLYECGNLSKNNEAINSLFGRLLFLTRGRLEPRTSVSMINGNTYRKERLRYAIFELLSQ